MCPPIDPPGAQEGADDACVGVDGLLAVGNHSGLDELDGAIANGTRVQAQIALGCQALEHGIGQRAKPDLKRRAVPDQPADMSRDLALDRTRWS